MSSCMQNLWKDLNLCSPNLAHGVAFLCQSCEPNPKSSLQDLQEGPAHRFALSSYALAGHKRKLLFFGGI